MKIINQYIGTDKYLNEQLIVETEDNSYYTLLFTNTLGFEQISPDEFKEMINRFRHQITK